MVGFKQLYWILICNLFIYFKQYNIKNYLEIKILTKFMVDINININVLVDIKIRKLIV